jgi:cobalt-zinc-cadmium efflux system protein
VTAPFAYQCIHQPPLRADSRRRMTVALGLTAAVMVVELVGGLLAGSLALLADAGHMLADVAALGIAVGVAYLVRRPATPERSFGLLRLEILAALLNGAVLIAIAVGIAIEAVSRLRAPHQLDAPLLMGVGTLGLATNVVAALILHRGHEHSLNQRGAYLHVLSDLLGSIGVITAGAIVLFTGWTAADPLVSLGIGALILGGAFRLVKESVDVLLEATPAHIPLADVHQRLASVAGVASVHDLHVWTVTSGVVAMSGHLVVAELTEHQRVLEEVQGRMRQLGIGHVTIQIEQEPVC